MVNDKVEKNSEVILIRVFEVLSIILLICMTILCFNNSIWIDEVFDLNLIENPYSYFIFSNRDSAPPVHFILLKFLVSIGKVIFPSISTIILAKLASLFPYYILFLVTNIKIKKMFGKLTAALFLFLCMTMPHMLGLTIEIRQYSWSILIAVLWFVAFYDYLTCLKWEKIVVPIILGVLLTLTHYYACFLVVIGYITYFLWCIKKSDKTGIKQVLAMMLGSCILFSPWLFIVNLSQEVNKFNLIINAENMLEVVVYVFFSDTNKFGIGYIVATILYIIWIFFLLYNSKELNDKNRIFTFIGLFAPIGIMIIGIGVVFFVAPAFQPRYIMPSMGCFWLAFSIMLNRIKDRKMFFRLILSFVVFVSFLDVYKTIKDENDYAKGINKVENILEEMEVDDILVSNDYRIVCYLPFFSDNSIIYLDSEDSLSVEKVKSLIEDKHDIYYFELPNYGVHNFIEQSEENGYSCESLGMCRFEYVITEGYRINSK